MKSDEARQARIRPQITILGAVEEVMKGPLSDQEKLHFLRYAFDALRESAMKNSAWCGEDGELASEMLENIFTRVGDDLLYQALTAPGAMDVRHILAWLSILDANRFPKCDYLVSTTAKIRFPAYSNFHDRPASGREQRSRSPSC